MSAAKEIAKAGRFGDTLVARISKSQAKLLKDMGGSGTINPQTGLQEFFDWGGLFTDIGTAAAPAVVGAGVSWLLNRDASEAQQNAANASADATARQVQLAEQNAAIGRQTGLDLRSLYQGLMETPGFSQVGQFNYNDMDRYVTDTYARMGEGRGIMQTHMDAAMGGAQGAVDAAMPGYRAPIQTALGRQSDVYGYMLGNGGLRDGRYTGDINSLAQRLHGSMASETDRSLQDALGDLAVMEANNGVGVSTAAIEARKAFGDAAARRRNLDTIQALQSAIELTGANQQLDIRAADANRLYGSTLATMARGMTADAINAANADQSLRFNEADRFYRDRALGRSDYRDGQQYVDDYSAAWRDAFARWADLQGLRGNTLAELTGYITTPATAEMGSIASAGDMFSSAAGRAMAYSTGLSQMLSEEARGWGGIAADVIRSTRARQNNTNNQSS